MRLRRIFLWPVAQIHGLILHIRHAVYDARILRTTTPAVKTIAIGNLALGGTGKTPMVELLLRILNDIDPIATLSRGYGRRNSGMHEVKVDDQAEESGDEPVQIKRKFKPILK